MVIWHLIDSRSVGGAERHIGILVKCLNKRNIPAEAVLYRDYGANPWLDQLSAERIPVRILDGTFNSLIKALTQVRPGLLHVHGYKAGILGRLPARLLRIPVVSTFHSGEQSDGKLGFYERADEWTAVGERIAVSAAVQARLPYASTLIANFVPDVPPPRPEALPRRVAFVGRLSPEKGPDIFCEIASQRSSQAEWHVYGDGPMRRELQVRFGGFIAFHGVVADLANVWPTLGLLLMPSRFEGLPYAALEAQSCGVPVLATRVGGLPAAVAEPETGWLFDHDDVSQGLGKLDAWLGLDPSEQNAIRMRCWRHVKQHFSESSEIPKLLSVYRKAGYPI